MSWMPVREALNRLNDKGLVQLTNNRGAAVIKHSLDAVGEVFDLRRLIEFDLLRRPIPKMITNYFALCNKLVKEMDALYEANNVARWGDVNAKYHCSLYTAENCKFTDKLLK